MKKIHHIILVMVIFLMTNSSPAWAAYNPLQCASGSPVDGTSLYNEEGACTYTGIQYIFSTIMCQFVSMINMVMGKLYCSIQFAVAPIIGALFTVFIVIWGVQTVTGQAPLNSKEVFTRIIKLTLVFWLVTDPTRGVSAGVAYMFDFFLSFIVDTTRWVVQVLDQRSGIDISTTTALDPGIVGTFKFIDDLIYNSFTGTATLTGMSSDDNAKVVTFLVGMAVAMPTLAGFLFAFLTSLFWVFMRTLLSFLLTIVAVSFLLGLSPIFISFMLFQITFQYFDTWLRFMISYSIQVMVSFAILTLYLYSLMLFSPFLVDLSKLIFPSQQVYNTAPSTWMATNALGVCPLDELQYDNATSKLILKCKDPNFDPKNNENDRKNVIPPTQVAELPGLVLYLFYNIITLIIVSYGFSTLQQNASQIARQIAGPSYVPILNRIGTGNNNMSDLKKATGEAKNIAGRGTQKGFNARHETKADPMNSISDGAGGGYMQQFSNFINRR